MKDETNRAAHLAKLPALSKSIANVKYEYSSTSQFAHPKMRVLIFGAVFNGYNCVLDEDSLNQLRNDPSVASIEPDHVASTSYAISPFQSSTLPARHRPRDSLFCTLLGYCPTTDEKNDGTGVDIYGLGECSCLLAGNQAPSFAGIMLPARITDLWLTCPPDTGIYIEHTDFGGRAVHGPAFGKFNSSDDGHG